MQIILEKLQHQLLLDLGDFDTGDLSEGTNLYYTDARFDAVGGATKDTGDLTEGTNLYYTDARFDTRLAAKDTSVIYTEGTNLYYTEQEQMQELLLLLQMT